MFKGERIPADPAEGVLPACVSVAVVHDAEGASMRTVELVHGSLNRRRAQKSTTGPCMTLIPGAYQPVFKKSRHPEGCLSCS